MALMKALIINKDALIPLPIPVMFNPPEYQIQKTNQFAEIGIPGLGNSLLQFVKGGSETLTMELFFDTTDLGIDVRIFSGLVMKLMEVDSETHAPPRLMFVWSTFIFPCVLESVTQKFDYFSSIGMPLRASLNVTFKSYNEIKSLLSEIPLLSPDRTKRRVFKPGETLQRIAAQEYEDPRQWRAIAQANNIDNPLTIPTGKGLAVPSLPGGGV